MSDVAITNIAIEIQINGDFVAISQDCLELFIHGAPDILISQNTVELFVQDYYLADFNSQIDLVSSLAFDAGPDPRQKWIIDDNSKKIYLIRIQLRRLTESGVLEKKYLYFSNFAFNTHPHESPPNTHFRVYLMDSGVPPLVQKLSELFYGISTPSYGQLVLNDVRRDLTEYWPPSWVWDGGEVYIRLTGDRQELPLIYALEVLYGQMGVVKFDEMKTTVEIFSKHKQLEKRKIAEDTFKGLDEQDIIGQIPYGYCPNVSPILIDDFDLIYKYSIVECGGVTGVYDDGVLLDPGDWEDDPVVGELTLLVNPVGQITCDIEGKKINGVFTAKRGDFILDALTVNGKITSAHIIENSFTLFNALVPGDSGIYITQTTTVLQFVADLLLPVLGFLIIDRFGKISIGIMSPTDGSEGFDLDISETNMLPISGGGGKSGGEGGDDKSLETSFYELETLSAIINKAIFLYDQNNTIQSTSSLGDEFPVESDTPEGRNRRAWLKEEWRKVTVPLNPSLALIYDGASEPQEPIPSYFRYQGDAGHFAHKWLAMFGFDRRIVHIKTKIEPLQFTINATARLSLRGQVIGFGRVIGYKEDYSDSSVITDFLV